ncbi:MAG TPA: hypothetical protein VKH41_09700 [Myxococcota bacterium]|nr:hypothetical protein [Myxococcota bacterium]
MASEPSIKGSALSSVVEDLRALRDSGRISIARLEKTLQPADLALLDTQIQPALWYPIQSYARLTEVLLEVLGRGDPQYIADRGARAAQRLWESGLYVQLQHGEEKAARARRSGGVMSDRDARVITTLSAAIFNFTRWKYRVEERGSVIEVSEAEAWPEVSVWAARGFLGYVVSRLRRVETAVSATRVAPDRIEFRFDVRRPR